ALPALVDKARRRPTAQQAIAEAAEHSRAGGRASVLLAAAEVVGSADAIRALATARAPVVVHVVGPTPASGWDALAAVLDLGVRAMRPFFDVDVVRAVARAKAIVVVEPLDVALAPCAPAASSVKAAFADALTWAPGFPGVGRIPPIVSVGFATLGEPGVTEDH